jgi:putative transposase
MLKTFAYHLYPSKPQARLLESTLETGRRWYNQCLAERRDAYQQRGESIGKYQQLAKVKEQKAVNPYAKSIHSHALQLVVTDLDKAFQAFFRRVKAGQDSGYPRFKGRDRFSSFGFKEYGNGFKIDGRRLRLSGIGRIAVRWHRPLEGQIKTVRVIHKAGLWYACFACDVEAIPQPATGQEIGIDVGVASLITSSDGEKTANPRWYRIEQRKLRVLQRRVARRKKGGKNRRKAVLALQRQHERIGNRRKDFLNKLAHGLIERYDRIALEDLRITTMARNPHLAKSILDAGWGYLIQRLTSKRDLQEHLFQSLRLKFNRNVSYEHARIGGGRPDNGLRFQECFFPIEVKHEFNSINPRAIHEDYLTQPDIYAAATDLVAFLLVLDLRNHNAAGHVDRAKERRRRGQPADHTSLYTLEEGFWVMDGTCTFRLRRRTTTSRLFADRRIHTYRS